MAYLRLLCLTMVAVFAAGYSPPTYAKGGPGADQVSATTPPQDVGRASTQLIQSVRRRGCVPSSGQCNDVDFRYTFCGRHQLDKVLGDAPGSSPSPCVAHCSAAPTPAQCRDQRWYNSICGLLERRRMNIDGTFGVMSQTAPPALATCTNELMTEATSSGVGFGTLPTSSIIVPPLNCDTCQNTAGTAIAARRGSVSRDDHQIIPLQTLYQGHATETFTELSKTPAAAAAYRAIHTAWREEWERNGNQVGAIGARQSHACYEYVYEKYFDWGRYMDATAPLGDDFRAVFDTAFAASPALSRSNIGFRGLQGIPLQQRNQTPTDQASVRFPTNQPKNVFLGPKYVKKAPGNPVEQFIGAYLNIRLNDTPFADQMIAWQQAAPLHGEDWAWHQMNGQALMPNKLDHEFERASEKIKNFRFLLTQRAKLTLAIGEILKSRLQDFPILVNDPIFDPSVLFVELFDQLMSFNESHIALNTTKAYRNTIGARAGRAPSTRGFSAGFNPNAAGLPNGTPTFQIYTPGSGNNVKTDAARGVLQNTHALIPYQSLDAWFLGLEDVAGLTLPQMTALAVAADQLIEDALMDVANDPILAGCLDSAAPTICDWSPRQFKGSINDPYTAEREVDFTRCMEIVGGGDPDFGALTGDPFLYPPYGGCPPVAGSNPPQCRTTVGNTSCVSPFRSSPDKIELYFNCQEKWLVDLRKGLEAQIGESIVDEQGNLKLSKISSDATSIGNDMFGINFSFTGGWGLSANSIPDFDSSPVNFCALDPFILGSAQASASVFYQDISLVDAVVDVSMQATDNSIHLEVLEETIFAVPSDQLQFTINQAPASIDRDYEDGERFEETFFSYGTTIVIVWVPVSLEAGLRGFIGLRGGASASINSCATGDISLGGHLTPYAGVEGYAEASIDALVVEAGVTGVLQIVRVDLPLVTGLSFTGKDGVMGKRDSVLTVGTSLDLELTLLSGYFAGFVEVCYILDCERAEAKIFSWEGPKLTTNLFSSEFQVGLIALDQIKKSLP